MSPKPERRHQTGNLHFITFSCQNRNPYLTTPDSKQTFLHILEQTRKRYTVRIVGYVVMPERVHLLISEPPAKPLSLVIAVLKREVSRKHQQKPFWLPRFYDFNIYINEKRIEKLRYLHRNPVTRGLVDHPEDYPWSSFRSYALHEPGPVTIDRE